VFFFFFGLKVIYQFFVETIMQLELVRRGQEFSQ